MRFSKNELIFLPLGGSGEIGMNCNLYHYDGSWILNDLGVMFGNSSISPNELVLPSINFILENDIKLDALILTHAHEDHIGQYHTYTISFRMCQYSQQHLQHQF